MYLKYISTSAPKQFLNKGVTYSELSEEKEC